jgi:hypothetical protein
MPTFFFLWSRARIEIAVCLPFIQIRDLSVKCVTCRYILPSYFGTVVILRIDLRSPSPFYTKLCCLLLRPEGLKIKIFLAVFSFRSQRPNGASLGTMVHHKQKEFYLALLSSLCKKKVSDCSHNECSLT